MLLECSQGGNTTERNLNVVDLSAASQRREWMRFWARTLILILLTVLVVLMLRYVSSQDSPSFWAMLILRVISILLPIYLIARLAAKFRQRVA